MLLEKDVTGIIIAGGRSTRMGEDKAFIIYNGKPLIKHIIDLLTPFCNRIIISANSKKYEQFNLELVNDSTLNSGPIAGIHAALSKSDTDLNIVIACDTPNVTPEIIELLISQSEPNKIIIPTHNNLLEPLCAIYPKNTISTIKKLISEGKFKLQNLPQAYPSKLINIEHILLKTPKALNNLNTKQDLQL